MILLAGLPEEPPMAAVIRALEAQATPCLVLDQRQAPLARLNLSGSHGALTGRLWMADGVVVPIDALSATNARPLDAVALPEVRATGAVGISAARHLDGALNLFWISCRAWW